MNQADEQQVRKTLHSELKRLTRITVVLYVIVVVLGTAAWLHAANQRRQLEEVAVSTASALCVLRHDLELRVETSARFLEDNPQGVNGITPDLIRQGIRNQIATIDALGSLECPPEEVTDG